MLKTIRAIKCATFYFLPSFGRHLSINEILFPLSSTETSPPCVPWVDLVCVCLCACVQGAARQQKDAEIAARQRSEGDEALQVQYNLFFFFFFLL